MFAAASFISDSEPAVLLLRSVQQQDTSIYLCKNYARLDDRVTACVIIVNQNFV